MGIAPLKSFFCQSCLPLAASKQERMPMAPRVTTLPSATAGELRGPRNEASIPWKPGDAYFSFHTSLPSAALRHARSHRPPLG